MVHELVRWSGGKTVPTIQVTAPQVTTPQDDASAIVAADLPQVLAAGSTYAASVTVRNAGTTAWTSDVFKLGAVGDSDPFYGPDPRVYMPAGTTVAPGDAWTFTFP